MPRRTLPLALLAIVLLPVAPAFALTQAQLDAQYAAGTIPFRDVPADHAFVSFISKLKDLKLTQGTGDGAFEPDRCASKAEVVKFALDTAAVPVATVATTPFNDVTIAWQRNYVEAARTKGFLPQIDVDFQPNACASRIFTLMVILRAAKLATPAVTSTPFADVSAPEQMAAVEVARSKNIIAGRSVNAFAPYDATLRKEMAKILVNTYTTILHPETVNDRRPDFDTAVRIQTVIDNMPTILSANGVPTTAAPVVTRFAFASLQYAYVDYLDGTAKMRVLLDITKPDANFRMAVVARYQTDANGVYRLSSGTDTQKDKTTTIYMKEGTLWLKQADVASTEQLFSNSAGYSLRIPKAWFYWNRGAVAPYANEAIFATAQPTETNWILAARVQNQTYGTATGADTGKTAEESIKGGVLRAYADGTYRVFLPFGTSKTLVFQTKAGVTKDALVAIVQSYTAS